MKKFLLIAAAVALTSADAEACWLRSRAVRKSPCAQAAPVQSQAVQSATPLPECTSGTCPLVKAAVQLPVAIVTGIAVGVGNAIAQSKAEIQARAGRCYHPGGSFGGGSAEGCGFSSASADDAIRHCCFWGQRTPIQIGVSRGPTGWFACVLYR